MIRECIFQLWMKYFVIWSIRSFYIFIICLPAKVTLVTLTYCSKSNFGNWWEYIILQIYNTYIYKVLQRSWTWPAPPFQTLSLIEKSKVSESFLLKKPAISLYTGVMLWRCDFQQLSRHLLSLAKYFVDKFLQKLKLNPKSINDWYFWSAIKLWLPLSRLFVFLAKDTF